MLLWMPVESASHASDHYYDVDEKGTKLRRLARKRAYKNAVACVASLLLVLVVTLLQWQVPPHHHHQPHQHHSGDGSNHHHRVAAAAAVGEPALLRSRKATANRIAALPPDSIYRLTVPDADGHDYSLSQHAGQVTLVVNTACHCGKTRVTFPQLAQLQSEFHGQGFSVLAFPSNDFRQELESDAAIRNFLNHEFPDGTVNYPVLGLSSLHDNVVYRQLAQHLPDHTVRHNFYKYLVDRTGKAVHLYPKPIDPLELRIDIEALLEQESPLSPPLLEIAAEEANT